MFMGTVVIPGALALLLIGLPFLDRSPARHPTDRKKTIFVALMIVALAVGLSIMGYIEHFMAPPR